MRIRRSFAVFAAQDDGDSRHAAARRRLRAGVLIPRDHFRHPAALPVVHDRPILEERPQLAGLDEKPVLRLGVNRSDDVTAALQAFPDVPVACFRMKVACVRTYWSP